MLKLTPKIIRAIIPLPLMLTVSLTSSWVGAQEVNTSSDMSQSAIASPQLEPMEGQGWNQLVATNSEQNPEYLLTLEKSDRTSVEMQSYATSKRSSQRLVWAKAARNEKTRECRVSGLCS